MSVFSGSRLVRWCSALAVAAVAGLTATPSVATNDHDDEQGIRTFNEHRHRGVHRPIIDTHIHFYQPTRPGGVPWPPAGSTLYRDVLPPEYKHLARSNGIVASGIVEASPLVEDNQWILDLVRGDHFFPFFVGQLEIGSSDFVQNLHRFAHDRRFVGIRGFLWSPAAGITLDPTQLAHLRELARLGMSLDIISRGTTNPKPQVEALCKAVPHLRIIINHLGGAQGLEPTPEWELSIRRLADLCPNLYMKFSSFYDMYQVGDGNRPWTAPLDLAAYKPHFDVLMTAFGAKRLIWGSNWPVSDLGGPFSEQIRLAEEYLAPFGPHVRNKVMFLNALKFYRRHHQHH